jgi:cell division protein FtsB
MDSRVKQLIGFVVAMIVCTYAMVALRGPRGLTALMEKRREITALQEQNATLARENQLKRDRIERLKHNPSEQELEIRRRLKLLRPGETEFILPDPPGRETGPAPPAQ